MSAHSSGLRSGEEKHVWEMWSLAVVRPTWRCCPRKIKTRSLAKSRDKHSQGVVTGGSWRMDVSYVPFVS